MNQMRAWQNLSAQELKRALSAYRAQRKNCSKRVDRNGVAIQMLLTFDEWMDIWWDSGHWYERGCKSGQYCMSRFNDLGDYAIGNVEIILCVDNLSQNSPHLKQAWERGYNERIAMMNGEEYKSKMSKSLLERFSTSEGRTNVIASHNTFDYRLKQRIAKIKPATVDGITIFPSKGDLIKALGQGKCGSRSPHFRVLDGNERELWILSNLDKITIDD